MQSYLEKFIIWEMILLSGSIGFYHDYPFIWIPIYVISCYILYHTHKIKNNKHNTIILALIVLWNVINTFIIHSNIQTNLIYSNLLFCLGSYYAISSMDFNFFREKLLKYFSYLCAVSIVVQLLHDGGFLTPTLSNVSPYLMTLNYFNCNWGEKRLASIYWEPGQFQIVIIFILCLFTDKLKDFEQLKSNIKKFGVIIISLLLTISTTGYLAFMIILFGILTNTTIVKKHKILMPFFFLLSIGLIFMLWNSSAIQDKLEQSKDINESSYTIRSTDNLLMIQMAKDSPLFGYGVNTNAFFQEQSALGIRTASNGWLYTAVSNGIPYLIFLLICIYYGIKRQTNTIPVLYVFLSLFISQCNEWLAVFPYIYMYIFKYKSYINT